MSGYKGLVDKMHGVLGDSNTVQYEFILNSLNSLNSLNTEDTLNNVESQSLSIPMNQFLGKVITLEFTGHIYCQNCLKKTKSSFSGGYCYPCSMKLAACDMCILKPETCHYHLGTCREPKFGEDFCFQDHVVYVANSSGPKVGITRVNQIPTRFIDQGATQALPIFQVKSRRMSGLIESELSKIIRDKTDWRKMLKGDSEFVDLKSLRAEIYRDFGEFIDELEHSYQSEVQFLEDSSEIDLRFPVEKYPEKVLSLSFAKNPKITGTLQGIKGQYLIFEQGVLNVRTHTSHEIIFHGPNLIPIPTEN